MKPADQLAVALLAYSAAGHGMEITPHWQEGWPLGLFFAVVERLAAAHRDEDPIVTLELLPVIPEARERALVRSRPGPWAATVWSLWKKVHKWRHKCAGGAFLWL